MSQSVYQVRVGGWKTLVVAGSFSVALSRGVSALSKELEVKALIKTGCMMVTAEVVQRGAKRDYRPKFSDYETKVQP